MMIRTWKGHGLVLAAPLLATVLAATVFTATVLTAPGAHADEGGVVLRTAASKKDVLPGRTYEWTFTVTAKGPAKSGKAVFRTTLPRSLAFVSGEKHCKSKGRKVVCRLGTLKKGGSSKGSIRAKVSRRAAAGQKITVRGTATWRKASATRRFPAVRVANAAGHVVAEPALATSRAGARHPH
ncbi:DUF11 domain-containing protein [Actinomadura sp. KC345]|uniref:DUF11 domain-containing protein n=1 Tax=Actinomadura sp. KC345 TaxID=2530371 RepID=UPI00104BE423|nr:DUF11 domain-containing protein [Actinomadura sp. KC345]TDC58378.1 DUF11 domain-containing protein [Actinomadura sp. KC345]